MKGLRKICFLKTNRYNHAIHISINELSNNLLEKYNMEITFYDIKLLKKDDYFNEFINIMLHFFMEYTKDNRPEPIYIPSQVEIISLDDGFIDAYYDSQFANEKDEILYLTKGFDISKPIITYDIDLPNTIEIRFNSMYCINEKNVSSSIWEVCDNEIRDLFKDVLLNSLNSI